MSIEIVGPKKYEFQDQVCCLIGLMHAENSQAQLYIEPNDGEDAQLVLFNGTDSVEIEIQVKGAKAKIDMKTLADWMAHFPARKSSDSLVERVVRDSNRIALVVATGRCDDATSVFQATLDEASSSHKSGSIQKKTSAALRKEFENYATARPKDEPLAAMRRKHIGTYITGLSEPELRQAAHRILLVELINDEIVQQERQRLLREIHGLPPDIVPEVLVKLDLIVVDAKRTGNNVLPRFRELISRYRPTDPLRPTGYLGRGDETALIKELSKQGFLLLSGTPRVGKTSTARWIAADLQAQGYKARVVESIAEAQRFLMDPVTEARLALVDDPFGGSHPAEAQSREFTVLEHLLRTLPLNRRLVVAQAEDRLLEVTRKSKIEEINIGGASWIPLKNKVGKFLVDLWIQECAVQRVPSPLVKFVQSALSFGELDLEPGCLVHLAANHSYLQPSYDLESIKRIARQDAMSLASAFRAEGLAPLAAALAVGTTPTIAIAPAELAFALGSGAPDRPGEVVILGTMVSMGARSQSSTPPSALTPSFLYGVKPELSVEQNATLERLEIRRMIEFPGGKGFLFTHPFYRAGSELLVDAATDFSTRSALATVTRCLFSLSSDTANAAAINLPWLYERLSTATARGEVVKIAIDGMNSMWQEVREKCLQFLAGRFNTLSNNQWDSIFKKLWGVSAFGRDHIEWANDRPFIPKSESGILEISAFKKPPPEIAIKKALASLADADQVTVSAEAAANAAVYLSNHPDLATAHIIGRLLSFELASLIRAPAAESWICLPRENDEALLSRIFGEEQPVIVSTAFKATVRVWWDCTQERRDTLQTELVRMAGSPVAAFTMFGHLVKFNRQEVTFESPPWALFEALMPKVMKTLPILPTKLAAHLYAVMEEAIKHIESNIALAIIDAWLTFVHDIATKHSPSDYLLGFTNILLDATKKDHDDRTSRIASALSISGTGARIRVITDLLDRWSDLTAEECNCVIGALTAQNLDANWLRAAAITRPQVPPEVQYAVLPEGINLNSSTEDLLLTLPLDLLKVLVRVYATNHAAIEYSVSRRFGNAVWEPVLEAIAADAKHPCFKQALQYLISSSSRCLSVLISSLGKGQADLIFELLLQHVTHSGGDFLPEAWEALLGLNLDDDIREEYFQRMADVAPMATESFDEIKSWIPAPYLKEFLKQLNYDINLINMADGLFSESCDSNGEEAREKFVEVVRGYPPKHWLTYEKISYVMRSQKAHNVDLLKEVERLGSEARIASFEKPEMVFEPLENWLDPKF
jgi:hypothetical protein